MRAVFRWELWSKKIGSFEIPKDAEALADVGDFPQKY